MKNISLSIQSKPFSSYISIKGKLNLLDALNFKCNLPEYCHSAKDLFIDIKEVKDIDINGLSALLMAKHLTQSHGGEFYLFVNKGNPIFALLSQIKFTNQLNFRDSMISDPLISIAS